LSQARVVITGMGWVTPLGCDVPSVWSRLLAGVGAAAGVTRYDARTFKTNFAAEVKGFRLGDFIPDAAEHTSAGLGTQFALAAAAQAWRQAGLGRLSPSSTPKARRVGAYLGAGEGSLDFEPYAAAHVDSWRADARRCDGTAWVNVAKRGMTAQREIEQEPNMTLAHLARRFGIRGPAFNCMTACAASTQAVGEAFEILKHGDADVMLAGGAHSMIHPLGMTGFIRLTAMSTRTDDPAHAARPFDQTRDGFVMGEGSGMLILETLAHARARGATPLAEIVGYGSSADAFRITDIQPDGRGAQATMLQACRQAGVNPREPGPDGRPPIHYISAHGTGTQENDKIETAAVKAVFGPMAPKVPFSSVKSMFGHLIQAAGAVELITCVKAIETGFVPPTMNLHQPDPVCDLDYVPNAARDLREHGGVDLCLSNSFGFGGQNNTLAVRKFNE
jgi:3-oxoacyl-[acyl-carrier-protein] synthase II